MLEIPVLPYSVDDYNVTEIVNYLIKSCLTRDLQEETSECSVSMNVHFVSCSSKVYSAEQMFAQLSKKTSLHMTLKKLAIIDSFQSLNGNLFKIYRF